MAGANQPSSSFNLSDVSLQEDPAGRFGQILEMGPIFRGKMPMLGKAWFATSWLAVTQSLRRTGDFVREPAQVGRKYHTWIQRILPSLFRKLSNSMHRQPNRHLTFGNGPHVCLGMNLARTETRLALQQMFSRWPELSADFDIGQPDFGRRLGMRTLKSMRLRRS